MKKIVSYLVSAVMLSMPIATVDVAHAQTVSGLGDLIGARGSSAESELEARGYKFAKNLGSAALWWNDRSKTCASVAVDNGRVQSIQTASASDCGKSGSSGSTAAGVIAGAAAVGLIAALSSHHKSGNDRNNNASYNAEYERGFSDAMYGHHYATNDSQGYHSGYMAGEAERNNRRHSNSVLVRGAPAAAQNACKERGDQFWGIPQGSTVPVSVYDYGQGNYEVTVASGHRRANCSANAQGRISDFLPL
jgi:hypothetical protein